MNKRRRSPPLKVIGPRILDNYKFLRKISKSKSEQRRLSLLRNANREQLLSLVEVAANILSSNFSLTNRQRQKLAPHASYLRSLARIRSERGAKRIVVQRGNGIALSALLIPVITEATRLLLSKVSKGVIEDN